MKLYAAALCGHGVVSFDGRGERLFRGFLHALVRAFNAFVGSDVVFVCEISRKIRRLKTNRVRKIVRLDRFHEIVRHSRRAVHGDVLESDAAAAVYEKVARLGVVVFAVAPAPQLRGAVSDTGIRVGVEQPERNVHALDLVDVVLILEYLRQKPLACQMLLKSRLCRVLIKLERDHKVGSERSRKLSHHYDGISAERA